MISRSDVNAGGQPPAAPGPTSKVPRAYEITLWVKKDGTWKRSGLFGEQYSAITYALTRDAARYAAYLGLRDCVDDLQLINVRARLTSREDPWRQQRTEHVAKYRNVPGRLGMRVMVNGNSGVIVNGNDSANFDVLFTDGPHVGQTLNCHPRWRMRYFDEAGSVLFDSDSNEVNMQTQLEALR